MHCLASSSGYRAGPVFYVKDTVHIVLSFPTEAKGCDPSNLTITYGPPFWQVEPPPQSAIPDIPLQQCTARTSRPAHEISGSYSNKMNTIT